MINFFALIQLYFDIFLSYFSIYVIILNKNKLKNIQVEFSLKTGTSTPLFITKKNHNSDTNTILPLF
jgi:hypothetical protein